MLLRRLPSANNRSEGRRRNAAAASTVFLLMMLATGWRFSFAYNLAAIKTIRPAVAFVRLQVAYKSVWSNSKSVTALVIDFFCSRQKGFSQRTFICLKTSRTVGHITGIRWTSFYHLVHGSLRHALAAAIWRRQQAAPVFINEACSAKKEQMRFPRECAAKKVQFAQTATNRDIGR